MTLADTRLEQPEKVVSLTERGRKRVKEWRQATFMKEGDESPRKDENFGASGSAVSFFVSEIWPFKVDFSARSIST